MTRPNLQSRVTRLDSAVHHGPVRASAPTILLMHTTEGDSAQSSIDYLNSTHDKKASYHYLIDRDGTMLRMTRPDIIAYHAGDSAWPDPVPATPENPERPNGGRSINAQSLGFAWAHRTGESLTSAQVESALWLCSVYAQLYNVPVDHVLGHYEASPGRKQDPKSAIEMWQFRALFARYLEAE